MKDMKPAEAAAREAYEEAGVRGTIVSKAIGSFSYEKLLDDESGAVPCEVKVFAPLAKRQHKTWPEKNERKIRWVDPGEAVFLVGEEALRESLDAFAKRVAGET